MIDVLKELRREILDEAIKNLGPRAVKTLLDDIAREAPYEMEDPDLSFLLNRVKEESERLNLDDLEEDTEPDDPCDEEFMEDIST